MTEIQFQSQEFDDWSGSYDCSVLIDRFPFHGYQEVLATIVSSAQPCQGLSVLDMGTGTGNLAVAFARLGCRLWCTDFSKSMLEHARRKLPTARLILHDLHEPLPPELDLPFDRILSAYVFHHFPLDEKIRILGGLLPHLAPAGRILIGDIAFPNNAALETIRLDAGDEWEQEYYWIATDSLPALEKAGWKADYAQVSSCAGVFSIQAG